MEFSSSSQMSVRGSIDSFISLNIPLPNSSRPCLTNGIFLRELRRARRSLALHVPSDTLPARRSISYRPDSPSIICWRAMYFSFASSTASSLLLIALTEIRGSSTHLRRSLAPIDVLVLSIAQRRDPLFCFVLIVDVSSRPVRVAISSSIVSEIL